MRGTGTRARFGAPDRPGFVLTVQDTSSPSSPSCAPRARRARCSPVSTLHGGEHAGRDRSSRRDRRGAARSCPHRRRWTEPVAGHRPDRIRRHAAQLISVPHSAGRRVPGAGNAFAAAACHFATSSRRRRDGTGPHARRCSSAPSATALPAPLHVTACPSLLPARPDRGSGQEFGNRRTRHLEPLTREQHALGLEQLPLAHTLRGADQFHADGESSAGTFGFVTASLSTLAARHR